jgi:hypothetical protein
MIAAAAKAKPTFGVRGGGETSRLDAHGYAAERRTIDVDDNALTGKVAPRR